MQIGPFTLARTKTLPPLRPLNPGAGGAWWPLIRESFTGAWQHNVEVRAQDVLTYSAVYACVSLIAGDIAKLCLRLVEEDDHGIWTEVDVAAFSPVLRKPNRYQTIQKFIEQWIVSKLTRGNTYVLKQRDNRSVVTALYILDASRVVPLVTPDGAVYYEIQRDDLAEVAVDRLVIPASEIIHDLMCPLYHPLIGVTPIYACGTAALQGLAIQNNSKTFFANGANPSGMLTAPGAISAATAQRLKDRFMAAISGENIGKVVVAGDGLKYEQFTMSAVDSQLIDQLKWTAETACSCFHVPPYLVGVGPPPPYANIEPLIQQYYSQCLQSLMTALEMSLDEGLGLGAQFGNAYGTEFDVDDLIWLDNASKSKAATDGIGSGGMSPNEARERYYALGPMPGGDTPYLQQQYWPLSQLSERAVPGVPAAPQQAPDIAAPPQDNVISMAAMASALRRKGLEAGYAI